MFILLSAKNHYFSSENYSIARDHFTWIAPMHLANIEIITFPRVSPVRSVHFINTCHECLSRKMHIRGNLYLYRADRSERRKRPWIRDLLSIPKRSSLRQRASARSKDDTTTTTTSSSMSITSMNNVDERGTRVNRRTCRDCKPELHRQSARHYFTYICLAILPPFCSDYNFIYITLNVCHRQSDFVKIYFS